MAVTNGAGDVFPRRNLPGEAEQWGRKVEDRIESGESSEVQLTQVVNNMGRATSGQLAVLAQQLDTLSSVLLDLRGREAFAPPMGSGTSTSSSGLYSIGPVQSFTLDVPRVVKLSAAAQVSAFTSGSVASAHLSFDLNGVSLLANDVARGFIYNQSSGTLVHQSLNSTALLNLPVGEYSVNPNILTAVVGTGTISVTSPLIFVEILQVVS